MLTLIVINGRQRGQVFHLQPGETQVLGRQGKKLKLLDSHISRHHSRVRSDEGHWVIEDLNSSNGTRVNELAIDKPRNLHVGDRIQLGRLLLVAGRVDEEGPREPVAADRKQQGAGGSSILSLGGDSAAGIEVIDAGNESLTGQINLPSPKPTSQPSRPSPPPVQSEPNRDVAEDDDWNAPDLADGDDLAAQRPESPPVANTRRSVSDDSDGTIAGLADGDGPTETQAGFEVLELAAESSTPQPNQRSEPGQSKNDDSDDVSPDVFDLNFEDDDESATKTGLLDLSQLDAELEATGTMEFLQPVDSSAERAGKLPERSPIEASQDSPFDAAKPVDQPVAEDSTEAGPESQPSEGSSRAGGSRRLPLILLLLVLAGIVFAGWWWRQPLLAMLGMSEGRNTAIRQATAASISDVVAPAASDEFSEQAPTQPSLDESGASRPIAEASAATLQSEVTSPLPLDVAKPVEPSQPVAAISERSVADVEPAPPTDASEAAAAAVVVEPPTAETGPLPPATIKTPAANDSSQKQPSQVSSIEESTPPDQPEQSSLAVAVSANEPAQDAADAAVSQSRDAHAGVREEPRTAATEGQHVSETTTPLAEPEPKALVQRDGTVFVIDASGSMVDTMPDLLHWLQRRLGELDAAQAVAVLFVSDRQTLQAPPREFAPLTAAERKVMLAWLDPTQGNVAVGGRPDLIGGLTAAVAYPAREIVVLSDGSLGRDLADTDFLHAVESVLDQQDIRINAVQFFYEDAEQGLAALAQQFGGSYEFVPAKQVETGPDPLLQLFRRSRER